MFPFNHEGIQELRVYIFVQGDDDRKHKQDNIPHANCAESFLNYKDEKDHNSDFE